MHTNDRFYVKVYFADHRIRPVKTSVGTREEAIDLYKVGTSLKNVKSVLMFKVGNEAVPHDIIVEWWTHPDHKENDKPETVAP